MDILNPDIEQIDGCYYRINPIDGFSFGKNVENLPYQEFGWYRFVSFEKLRTKFNY